MAFHGDSIYWVEVEKIVPNPFQPRREFDEAKLRELGESIRMYGVLQPLTVTRQEVQNDDGTFYSQYELIAGERRLRASKLAGVAQVPVIIREGEDSEQEKLELAIIENLQREDLNAIDRALAFQQLADEFKLSHTQVAKKVGRSREYVANSIRLLQLPKHMQESVQRGELGEGHARTLLMLVDKPEEQETLFREVLLKKMSVRELERITRKIATDKVRKVGKADIDQHLIDIEKEFTETLGTRVQIQKTDFGGKLTIDYFSEEDLSALLERIKVEAAAGGQPAGPLATTPLAAPVVATATPVAAVASVVTDTQTNSMPPAATESVEVPAEPAPGTPTPAAEPLTAKMPQPQSEPATPPVADRSLLERLAAHTPLSFGATATPPEPIAASVPVVPAEPNETTATQVPTTEPTSTPAPDGVPAAQPADSAPLPQNLVSDTPVTDLPTAPAAPEPASETPVTSPQDDDQDLYSLRNFTV